MRRAMLTFRLEQALERRLAALSRVTGRRKGELVHDALLKMIEDREDLQVAQNALRRTRSGKPLSKVRKRLYRG